jgi:hypothetical protein
MSEVSLKCTCGKVRGVAINISTTSGNRLVCYCKDCQAFAQYLHRENEILDEYGGTDIFQMPLAHVHVTSGTEYVRCVRLTSKGMHRWYTDCCKTPIGNTLTAGVPFIGVISTFMDDKDTRNSTIGRVRGYMFIKSAKGTFPADRISAFTFLVILRAFSMMFVWKLKGLNKPSSFFTSEGTPVSEPIILKVVAK